MVYGRRTGVETLLTDSGGRGAGIIRSAAMRRKLGHFRRLDFPCEFLVLVVGL